MRPKTVANNLTLSVSQLNEYVRRMFQLDPMLARVDLKGEISNLKFHQSGMLFFTMKDDQAAIACAMTAEDAAQLQTEPFEGMRAVATGSVGLYARGGRYQFYVRALHPQGMGVLYERLQALKGRLEAEGLFDAAAKQPIPAYVDTVGVVTSPTGAVIHDILNVSLRRDPQARILLCPVRVQGVGAAEEIARGIRLLERLPAVSVIIVARGGGSMEDLFTFNEESVVRAVASCSKPIVSAVGHETDVTLCDLAADLRAPTPSAAAECVVPRRDEMQSRLLSLRSLLSDAAQTRLEREGARLSLLRARLAAQSPLRVVEREAARLEGFRQALARIQMQALVQREALVAQKKRELELLSPYAVLARGYAIVRMGDKVVESAARLGVGDEAELQWRDGSARVRVLETQRKEMHA